MQALVRQSKLFVDHFLGMLGHICLIRDAQPKPDARLVDKPFDKVGFEPGQVQTLIKQLEVYVDAFAGDAKAELPDQDRTAGSPLSSLAKPLLAFATALLKFKLSVPSTVKLLRRLLAALLPDGSSKGDQNCSV